MFEKLFQPWNQFQIRTAILICLAGSHFSYLNLSFSSIKSQFSATITALLKLDPRLLTDFSIL